jgi:photosystem II stability/assembly factor-like uncharacterized protein
MTLTLSHGGPTIYANERASDEVLVGTQQGIVRLRNEDGAWRRDGDMLTDLHISAILLEPTSGRIFAGAYEGSLHMSKDGGATWQRCDNGLAHHDVYSLASRTLEDGSVVLYCGTEPAHLFESRDLGETWTELSSIRTAGSTEHWTFPAPPHVAHLKHITFDPRDNNVIYASIEQGGLLKSRDGGASWRDMDGVDDDVHRVVLSPQRPDRLYITGGDGMYVSEDGGETFAHWHTQQADFGGYPDQLVFRPSNVDEMYIASAESNPGMWFTSHNAGSRFSRSLDGGKSWTALQGGLPDKLQSSIEAMLIEEWDGGFRLIAASTAGEIWVGENGETWTCVADDLAPISKAGHYRMLIPA